MFLYTLMMFFFQGGFRGWPVLALLGGMVWWLS